ncbi:type III-A CRISPR-associated RAMP protein Csm5 [Malaciobacter molluscorum LMG 25693]|uniref:CRISPR system Cms protein Csm5 n=1 Tax=Malaciobacter molluscorum LMG 25693 TaxID=870501 RepID=A0A2G1DJ95_9BACT|nr:type III-A CRISPR-associated RAMP protein Csm5 [Malaciobacter molluscorum]AXX91684.1 CRISPR/Cas system-associated RAMP protein Csm5, type III-A [Malaciobacter molluscorum LMG 25693]PHO18520.1 type III-A CRISPR-associated RAMP protein Csm5 [Malaciobacter molluscorum LMG 25693]
MAKYKITVLTPLHIGTGNSYSQNFNMLCKGGFVYFYDEFKLVDFLLSKDEYIPEDFNKLKEKIKNYKDEIIKSNLHLRKIKNDFSSLENKDVLENVSSSNKPIVAGSSIKGAIRTAVLNSLQLKDERNEDLYNSLKNKNIYKNRFSKGRKTEDTFDEDFKSLFTYLKISDSIESNLNTQIFKSINIKKNKKHQSSREKRVINIQNNVECISAKQMFYIDIKDESIKKYGKNIFSNLGKICNKFYLNAFNKEKELYFNLFSLGKDFEINEESNDVFLLNIGRFSGAEMKSLDNFRYIKNSKSKDKKESSTRTFALKDDVEDNVYFEKELLPFGWVLCELVKD